MKMTLTHKFAQMTPDKRPQDPHMDGTGLRFETMDHGGEYPDTMPQAIKLIDAEGRSCIYVPIPAVEPDDDEGIEQVETDSWNNEQVHGGKVRRVITQERSPSLAGRPPSFDHVLGDFDCATPNPSLSSSPWIRGAPQSGFSTFHPPDQYPQLCLYLRSPSQRARLPTPVTAKADPMPTRERLGSDDYENLQD
jgi:hypothetical protein